MKSKSKNAPLKRKHEFRFYKILAKSKTGRTVKIDHPAYIFLEKGNIYIFVTITHSEHVAGHVLVKLTKNPNPGDNSDSFWVAQVRYDTKDKFGKRHDDWEIDNVDDKIIRDFFEKEKDDSASDFSDTSAQDD